MPSNSKKDYKGPNKEADKEATKKRKSDAISTSKPEEEKRAEAGKKTTRRGSSKQPSSSTQPDAVAVASSTQPNAMAQAQSQPVQRVQRVLPLPLNLSADNRLITEPEPNPKAQKKPPGRPPKDLNPVIAAIFNPSETPGKYLCRFCPPGSNELVKKSFSDHIKRDKHENWLRTDVDVEANKLAIQYYIDKKDKDTKRNGTLKYLEFLAFAMKSHLSFEQIGQLGKFLKQMAIQNQITFFKYFSFDTEEISKLAKELGDSLLKSIKKDLESTQYSLMVDNATISGTSVCGLMVRYLKESKKQYDCGDDKQMSLKLSDYQNKLIGVKYLRESSVGSVMLDVVKEKVFDQKEEFDLDLNRDCPEFAKRLKRLEQLKENLVGLTHDRASNLAGVDGGLGALLKDELDHHFFDLPDPCHSLNLSLRNSLDELPKGLTNFIDKVHGYFSYPQRVQRLTIIQTVKGMRILSPTKYVETRWLSLGKSLETLTEIWPALQVFFEMEVERKRGATKLKCKSLLTKLQSNAYRARIVLLNGLVRIFNIVNTIFQKQDLEVHCINTLTQGCIMDFAQILFKNEPPVLAVLKTLKLDDTTVQADQFENDFDKLSSKIQAQYGEGAWDWTTAMEVSEKEKILKEFVGFLTSVLTLLLRYMPHSDNIVRDLSFVSLLEGLSSPPKKLELKAKLSDFNNTFNILSKSELKTATDEVDKIQGLF